MPWLQCWLDSHSAHPRCWFQYKHFQTFSPVVFTLVICRCQQHLHVFYFNLLFFFVRLVKWNPGKTHIYFREVSSKCPSILADVSAEMLSLWFQEAVGEHCLLSHYGLWCGDIDRQGLGGDETHFFTACDLTQASHPAQCSHLECLDSLRYMLLAVLMVLSLVSQWWTLLRLRLGSCQQMLSFHSKNRGF